MNTNDYTDKINNLLNDDKTYHKITDKRRNPTPKNPSINFSYRLKISQPHTTTARNSWNRSSTTNFIAPIPHQRHFMAFLKSIRRTSHSDQL